MKDLTEEVDREKAGREEAVKTAKEKTKTAESAEKRAVACGEIPGLGREEIGEAGGAAK